MPSRSGFNSGRFHSRRIGRAPSTIIRIQIQRTVIPIRATGTAVRTVIPITAKERLRHTSQESRRLRRTLSHHFNLSIRAPAGRGFSALVFRPCCGPCAAKCNADYIVRLCNGSDAPRAPESAARDSAPLLQAEPREPQYAPLLQLPPRSALYTVPYT